METENRRRSGGSDKTSKKGGKRDEEEAKRREVVMETLGQRFELEKRAMKVVERLLEDRVAEDFLVDCARFIAPANYTDAIEERSIAKLCGYPLCSNKLGQIPTQKYKISTKTNKVYDITERKSFCSNFCYKASKEFELQISTTPLWLRQHERPAKMILMKQGDGGSSGEVVMLLERSLQEEDVESPLAAEPAAPRRSQLGSAESRLSPDGSSDVEEEQDFVSSVVSPRQGPRVHWGNLPKRTDEDKEKDHGKMERLKKQRGGDEKEVEGHRGQGAAKMRDAENQLHSSITEQLNGELVPEERGLADEPGVEEAIAKMNLTNSSETVAHTAPPPVDSTAKPTENTNLLTSPPCKDPNGLTESTRLPSPTLINTYQDGRDAALTSQPGLHITQVGMSRRGAAGLRQLLQNYAAAAEPSAVRLNLLQGLRKTLKDWSTDETLKFLYGADHSLCSPSVDVKEDEEVGEEEEELDEDDLDDEVTNEDAEGVGAEVLKRPTAAAPDYHVLQQETQQLELRVREFYKGTWILPEEEEEEEEELHGSNQLTQDPALPLVDSRAQHLIQKRIAVQKLTSCLRNIVGRLHLNISDFSTDLNKLVKTFRFTSTNIIHRTPEWTFLAVVLLHLLSGVCPVVREALETPTSAKYLNSLMEELGLQEPDLQNTVQLFNTHTHTHTDTH